MSFRLWYTNSYYGRHNGHSKSESVKKEDVSLVKAVFRNYHGRRYSSGKKYMVTDEGFLERMPYTEDLFTIAKSVIEVSADGKRINQIHYIHSYSDVDLADRRLTKKRKIRFCRAMGIQPVAVYRISIRYEKTISGWNASLEIARSYRGEKEKVDERYTMSFTEPGALQEKAGFQH